MENYIEELVAEYYLTKGYLVTKNYWFSFKTTRKRTQRGKPQKYKAQSWTDIDVLAKSKKELLIIQVKATINEKRVAKSVITHFQRVDKFLKEGKAGDGESDIKWWKLKSKRKNIVVYGDQNASPKYLNILKKKKLETVYFKTYLKDILEYIKNKEGVKEELAAMRPLHFLYQENYLQVQMPANQALPAKNSGAGKLTPTSSRQAE